jgi:hypothetical protein
MKKITILILFLTFALSCCNVKETKKLDLYLKPYGINIIDYKVICIVPADGCGSCIDPSINYSRSANKNFLLVMSSIYKKSMDSIIELKQINVSNIVLDSENLAAENGLVSFVSPCFYFLKNGRIIKKVDLNLTYDKTSVFTEVDKFLSK